MIEIVTFTGVDAKTDLDEVVRLAAEYPFAEFAVLVRSITDQGNPKFPSMRVISDLNVRLPFGQKAIHLCGIHAKAAAGPSPRPVWAFVSNNGFGRIQINLSRRSDLDTDSLARFATHSAAERIILQHRGPWSTVPLQHPKVEYLFDRSGGRGLEEFERWPTPPEGARVGYAGGVGPDNIDQAIAFANQHPDAPIWIDMEHNIRTPDNWFDLDKVRAVCKRVSKWRS